MQLQREPMSKNRLESFSDGVIAVIITVLVLNLRAPVASGWAGWRPGILPMLIYAMGFQLTAAMWMLHHNTMARLKHLNRKMIWANFMFLLLLSLFPVTVQAVSLHPHDPDDLAVFCANALGCGIALALFRLASVHDHAEEPGFLEWNAKRSRLAYLGLGGLVLAMALGFYSTLAAALLIACAFVLVLITG